MHICDDVVHCRGCGYDGVGEPTLHGVSSMLSLAGLGYSREVAAWDVSFLF